MSYILDETVSEEDLEKFEKIYSEELARDAVTDKTKFEYALCLVKSKYPIDIGKGIILLNELYRDNADDRRDYLYYLAVGNARLKKYGRADEILDELSRTEPTNHQVLQLKKYIQSIQESRAMFGAITAGGALLLVGSLVAFGVALAKKSNS